MKKIKDYTGLIVILAVGALGAGAFYYQSGQSTAPPASVEPIVIEEPIVIDAATDALIELPEVTVVSRTEPFRSGTKACQWYEDAGMRAVSQLDGHAESTCSGNTCFLLVHDSGMPAGPVMLAWISEARSNDHDPRKENVELSVFTFEDGKETDHIIYFPKRDVFESF